MFRFDAEKHAYYVDEVRVPSVPDHPAGLATRRLLAHPAVDSRGRTSSAAAPCVRPSTTHNEADLDVDQFCADSPNLRAVPCARGCPSVSSGTSSRC